MGWEFIALFFGAAALGIFLLFAVFIIGLLKWLLQGYFLFRVADIKSYHLPWLAFIPFGTFCIGGQGYDGNILKKGSFDPKHIGLAFAITGLVLYMMGLSNGDLVITYLLMESIAFIGIFTAYVKQQVIGVLLALLSIVTAVITTNVILFLNSRKLIDEFNSTVLYGEYDLTGNTAHNYNNHTRPSHPNDP